MHAARANMAAHSSVVDCLLRCALLYSVLAWSALLCSALRCFGWSVLVWSALLCSGLLCCALVGLFWSGLAWSDLVCFAVFWSGLVWFGMLSFGLVWSVRVCTVLVWSSSALCNSCAAPRFASLSPWLCSAGLVCSGLHCAGMVLFCALQFLCCLPFCLPFPPSPALLGSS